MPDLVAPRFLLATLTNVAQGWLSPEARDVWQRLGGERMVIGRVGEERTSGGGGHRLNERGRLFADWMAGHAAAAVVARPDRYVYGIARDQDKLNRMIGRLGQYIFGSIA